MCWFLGASLSEFMRTLGVYSSDGKAYTRLRNQMDRLFNAHVSLIYEDERGKATVNSLIARRTEFWWNPKRPEESTLWESKIELGEDFFNEIINHPVPLDINIPHGYEAVLDRLGSLPLASPTGLFH